MSKIAGTYKLEANEDTCEFFDKLGASDEKKEVFKKNTEVEFVEGEGEEGEWRIVFKDADGSSHESTFVLGKEFDETFPLNWKTVATLEEENYLKLVSSSEHGDVVRDIKFTEEGLTINLSNETLGVKAKRVFKRV